MSTPTSVMVILSSIKPGTVFQRVYVMSCNMQYHRWICCSDKKIMFCQIDQQPSKVSQTIYVIHGNLREYEPKISAVQPEICSDYEMK